MIIQKVNKPLDHYGVLIVDDIPHYHKQLEGLVQSRPECT